MLQETDLIRYRLAANESLQKCVWTCLHCRNFGRRAELHEKEKEIASNKKKEQKFGDDLAEILTEIPFFVTFKLF